MQDSTRQIVSSAASVVAVVSTTRSLPNSTLVTSIRYRGSTRAALLVAIVAFAWLGACGKTKKNANTDTAESATPNIVVNNDPTEIRAMVADITYEEYKDATFGATFVVPGNGVDANMDPSMPAARIFPLADRGTPISLTLIRTNYDSVEGSMATATHSQMEVKEQGEIDSGFFVLTKANEHGLSFCYTTKMNEVKQVTAICSGPSAAEDVLLKVCNSIELDTNSIEGIPEPPTPSAPPPLPPPVTLPAGATPPGTPGPMMPPNAAPSGVVFSEPT